MKIRRWWVMGFGILTGVLMTVTVIWHEFCWSAGICFVFYYITILALEDEHDQSP